MCFDNVNYFFRLLQLCGNNLSPVALHSVTGCQVMHISEGINCGKNIKIVKMSLKIYVSG